MRRRNLVLLAIGALTLTGAALVALAPADGPRTLRVDGRDRSYVLRLPPGAKPTDKLPLVIVLHGGGGNATNAERMTGMTPFAARHGFAVAYPNGTGRLNDRLLTWNSGNCCGYAHRENVDDVAFLRALIADATRNNPIDPTRVYVTGMSNGGMMSHRVAQEMGDVVAAVGSVAGAMNSTPQRGPKVGVLMIHGKEDRHVLYGGGETQVGVESGRVDTAMATAMEFWTARNGLQAAKPRVTERDGVTRTVIPGEYGVESVLIAGEGHTWPGGNKGSFRADPPSKTVNANELLWEFFKRHRRLLSTE